MIETIQKIVRAGKYITTYKAGLLQAKAYRILKQHTAGLLKVYKISTLDWALMGMLYDDQGVGLRFSYIAEELGVEAPLVTRMVTSLKKKQFVDVVSDKDDSRAKCVTLTAMGKKLVPEIEKHLRANTKPLFGGVSVRGLAEYISVLEALVSNSKEVLTDNQAK